MLKAGETMGIAEPDLLLQRVYQWERERADRTFLTQPYADGKVRDWTWREAMDEVRRMASHLKSQNPEPGARTAILSKNCAWWVMSDLAIWMAGHVTVPVYPSLKAQSVRQILEHSGARMCFLGAVEEAEAAREGIPAGMSTIRLATATVTDCPTWEATVAACPPLAGNPVRPGGDLATIIYTSGTTGTPKGVMHSFAALSFVAKTLANLLGISAEQRVLSYLPLAHIVERCGVEAPALFLGSRLFFTAGIQTFLQDLQRAKPTLFLSVPRLLLKFQQGVFEQIPREKLDRLLHIPAVNLYVRKKVLKKLGLNTVRMAACGAAPLPTEILCWYRNLGLELAEGYGMTETMITHLPTPKTVRPGYVGPPLPGVEQKLGEGGELLVRSPMNMMGYYRDAESTKKAFTEEGYFRTGDLVKIDLDGQLKIIGRVKEQFKTSKGKYVAPAPIESRLMTHPAVEGCCLMGAGHPTPFAIVVLTEAARAQCTREDDRKALEESLKAQLEEVNAQLDPHERVSLIAIVNGPWTIGNGLLTPTLKLKRGVLEHMYQPYLDMWSAEKKAVVWESAP